MKESFILKEQPQTLWSGPRKREKKYTHPGMSPKKEFAKPGEVVEVWDEKKNKWVQMPYRPEMKNLPIRMVNAKVKKGEIRNTVLRRLKELKKSVDLLDQCKEIKSEEVKEFKGTEKGQGLKSQVSIISSGLKHIAEAIKALEKYKDTSVSH